MRVKKRDGTFEPVSFDKILVRISKLVEETPALSIDSAVVAQKVCSGLYDGVTSRELDELTAETCISMITKHPHYGDLASRVLISNHHKNTGASFSEAMLRIATLGILNDTFLANVRHYAADLDRAINQYRDYMIDYFGFKTLERNYLQRVAGEVVERPQYMFMRVALAIHAQPDPTATDFQMVIQTYNDMSEKYYIHATPTLFNAGMRHQQMSSCYLVAMKDDSVVGIFDTLKECALISKWAGGIGLHIHQIRGDKSRIESNNGRSDGIVPMLRVYNDTSCYINQAGKRPGSFAVYLEPWHTDIESFLELKKNHGKEEERARDLFYALWIPDAFMRAVRDDKAWYLMCPRECPGLSDVYGEDFDRLYEGYIQSGRYRKEIPARTLWRQILTSQIETGTPYILYKDHANRKSNQKNLGTIKSSNLCTEIMEYSDEQETAVCNLASIGLPSYVSEFSREFNHALLATKVEQIVANLNRVIDINFYPTENCSRSNLKHRPIGIGVQGLADVFMRMNLDWESEEARRVNREIFETIYYAALSKSCELAIHDGTYASYEGSPMSRGQFQFDLWQQYDGREVIHSGRWDWEALRQRIFQHGVRNSLLVAPMPTASTSQILGFTECFEPITSNIYSRRTQVGEFPIVNRMLVQDCLSLGLWSEELKNRILVANGSIQGIAEIPDELKRKYRTVWEIKPKTIIDMAADRGVYICQSQSMNLFMAEIDMNRLSNMHLYTWRVGLKTGQYYLRTRPVAKTQQFTITPPVSTNTKPTESEQVDGPVCRKEEGCIVCSS